MTLRGSALQRGRRPLQRVIGRATLGAGSTKSALQRGLRPLQRVIGRATLRAGSTKSALQRGLRPLQRAFRRAEYWCRSGSGGTVESAGTRGGAVSMVVSHSHRFAFIHVPKTGGSSISHALRPFRDGVMRFWMNRWLDRVGIHVNYVAPHRWKRFRLHTPASVLHRQLPADVYDGLFTFAFVRNPWDLLVSSYHFITSTPQHHRRRRTVRLDSFERYVDYEIRRGKLVQSRMLCDRQGRLLVDYVGRFESLHDDFAEVCRRIGVTTTLPHVNRSRAEGRRDYRDYYTPALAAHVATHFAEDVERFGYRFDATPRSVA
jgi:hypothetical protein